MLCTCALFVCFAMPALALSPDFGTYPLYPETANGSHGWQVFDNWVLHKWMGMIWYWMNSGTHGANHFSQSGIQFGVRCSSPMAHPHLS